MKRAALYTRTTGETPYPHLNELRQFAGRHGMEIVKEFNDTTQHENSPRTELGALLEGAKRRQFDLVLVWQCHLIARSLSHFLDVLQTLSAHGIGFISVHDNLDTSGPLSHAVGIIASAAMEVERNLAAERVRAGVRRARSAGRRLGRKRLAIDCAALQRDRARGLSLTQLARLHRISRTTVSRALKRAEEQSPASIRESQPETLQDEEGSI